MKKYKVFSPKIWQTAATVICLIITVAIFIKPKEITEAVKGGLIICGETVIPSLFPFTVIALFMYESGITNTIGRLVSFITKPIFKLNSAQAGVLIMSFLSGYPIGAKLINEMYEDGQIGKNDAETMLFYCVNGGPAFIVLAVGYGFLRSERAGVVLLVSHILSSLIICFITSLFQKRKVQNNATFNRKPILNSFVDSVAGASTTVFSICSWVILFSVFSQIILMFFKNETALSGMLAFCEVTSGVERLAKIGTLPSIAFALGFGGMSVIMQILSSLKNIKINLLFFILVRLIHGAISSVICSVILKLFPLAVNTVATPSGNELHTNSGSIALSFALTLTCFVFMFFYKSERLK